MSYFEKLPYFIKIDNIEYKINVDFRNVINIEEKLLDSSISKRDKIEYTLSHFYLAFYNIEPNTELYEKMIEKFLWFYKCGKEDYHKSNKKGSSSDRIYDYNLDEELIYGAFYGQYNLDLTDKKLHWWKFRALLLSLKEDTEFVKVKSYRAYNGDDKQLNELKEYWKLPKSENEEKRLQKIYDTLK